MAILGECSQPTSLASRAGGRLSHPSKPASPSVRHRTPQWSCVPARTVGRPWRSANASSSATAAGTSSPVRTSTERFLDDRCVARSDSRVWTATSRSSQEEACSRPDMRPVFRLRSRRRRSRRPRHGLPGRARHRSRPARHREAVHRSAPGPGAGRRARRRRPARRSPRCPRGPTR